MPRGEPCVGLLAAALSLAACAASQTPSVPAVPARSSTSYASTVDQLCRSYADLQRALPANLMYARCMYARGYVVPGFSPSPDSPGYQGGLPGPPTHNGGA